MVRETEHPFISRLIPISAPEEWFESHIDQLADATRRGDPDEVRRLLFAVAGVGFDGAMTDLIDDDEAPHSSPARSPLSWERAGSRPEATGA